MESNLKAYEKQIKRKHHVAWSPKHTEEVKTSLKPALAILLVEQAFLKLGWEIVYLTEKEAEAFFLDRFNFRREKVSVAVTSYGVMSVKSESMGNEWWDMGRNSKRVRLFIHAFQQEEKSHSSESLKELARQAERQEKWEDYEEPEALPSPPAKSDGSVVWAIVTGVLASILLSAGWAKATLANMYIILLFEALIAIALAQALALGFRKGNFTHFTAVQWILGGCVMLIACLYQYFQYLFIVGTGELMAMSIWDLLNERLSQGLIIEGLNLGAPGWMILLAVQPILIYLIALVGVSRSQMKLLIDRVPTEVVEYAYFHVLQGKGETDVRRELSKKGWKDKGQQDMVFEALGAIYESMELNRD